MARPDPYFFWVNRYNPYMIGNESPAHEGRAAIMRTTPSGSKGEPMIVVYRIATAAQVLAWKNLAEGFTTFNTTSIHSTFITGHTVMFSMQNPLVYDNELGLKDIDIGDSTLLAAKPGFDYWRGTMSLIIIS